METKPFTYLDRNEHISTNKYVFISYSHRDSDIVYPLLHRFYESGLNYWYDKEMRSGESWFEMARKQIENDDCVGAIFFLSTNCLIGSDSVIKEIELISKKNMKVIPIIICSGSYYCLVRDAFCKLKDAPHKQLNNDLSFDLVSKFLDFFKEEKIFKSVEDINLVEDVLEELKKDKVDVISSDNSTLEKLVSLNKISSIDGHFKISLSKMPDEISNNVFCLVKKGLFTFKNLYYYKVENGDIYNLKPINWTLLDIVDDQVLFISEDIFDVVKYFDVIDMGNYISKLIESFIYDYNAHVSIPSFEDIVRSGDELANGVLSGLAKKDRVNINFAHLLWCVDKDNNLHCINNKGEEIKTPLVSTRASLRFQLKLPLNELLNK